MRGGIAQLAEGLDTRVTVRLPPRSPGSPTWHAGESTQAATSNEQRARDDLLAVRERRFAARVNLWTAVVLDIAKATVVLGSLLYLIADAAT